jgi:pimeloyl-ACP methyl ester carboxylesterase
MIGRLLTRNSLLLLICAALYATSVTLQADEGAAETRGFYKVRGATIYVETFGAGTPILFLHGGLLYFDNNFARQREYFSTFRKVIGIDRRGHGHSPDSAEPFSYREMMEDTAAIIEQLGIGPVDVVGRSDGGNIGLLLARHHPQLVRRLVVSGANLRAGLRADELEQRSRWTPKQVAEKVQQLEEKLPPSFSADYRKVAPDGPGQWATLLAKSYNLWLTPVIIDPAELKSIKIPVLVMSGDHDFTSIEETVEIFRGLPRGQLFILPGTGHGTMMERPELANAAMRDFLEAPDPPASGQ